MDKFKVGDKVKRLEGGCYGIKAGEIYTISRIKSGWLEVEEIKPQYDTFPFSERGFELVDPIKEAKAILEKAGYTITPPKPKAKGKIYITRSKFGNIWPVVSYPEKGSGYEPIAIVDWTEGDGLSPSA